ncbi:MAG: HEAT repeat domain-containing protein [Defluviitaleaceae bacterium]|nr:HEAT repeat domain-containing protein [Defluviitaleaceae bacterium]
MTAKIFLRNLRRGLGSAIVELHTNPNHIKYKAIVLRCCLKDIAYDTQSEGTKGFYLYTAIRALEAEDEFEDIIINAFMKRLEIRLFHQLADILCLYIGDGSEKAENAFNAKYRALFEQLSTQRTFPHKYCEREQFEYLMICKVDNYNWQGFKECITDAGSILIKRNDDVCNSYDWFLCRCENIFGKKRVTQYFTAVSEKSPEVKAFVAANSELENTREGHLRTEQTVTLQSYIERAKELENDTSPYAKMHSVAVRLLRHATQDDLIELIAVIANEQSDKIRAYLLHIFRRVDFPADIDMLIKYAESNCELLQTNAVEALKRFEDPRIHDLAVTFIAAGNTSDGLPLLKKNWRKQDEPLIREHVLLSSKVSHDLQMDILDIYSQHRSKSCGDILEHIYRNGECAYCRYGIVSAMRKNRVLSEKILNECLYDSYDKTRKLANRIKRKYDNLCGMPKHSPTV